MRCSYFNRRQGGVCINSDELSTGGVAPLGEPSQPPTSRTNSSLESWPLALSCPPNTNTRPVAGSWATAGEPLQQLGVAHALQHVPIGSELSDEAHACAYLPRCLVRVQSERLPCVALLTKCASILHL